MNRLYDEWQEEQARKADAVLEMPRTLDSALGLIGELQEDVRKANEQIDGMHRSAVERESPRARVKDWILGGIVGAVISIILGVLWQSVAH